MTRLWDRGEELDALVARFTVGTDPELDRVLVAHDALASAAHATMLARIGVLSAAELSTLLVELRAIAEEARAGTFVIALSDEDGHTAIENRLTARLGDAGRRIHTGRSRNDQVIAALRLFGRETLLDLASELCEVIRLLVELAERHREVSVAGYTHTRQAMPATLGFFFAAHAEGLLDDLPWLQQGYAHLNRSPLGSASGYGVALPLDRQLVSDLLRFERLQLNTLAVQNDRGKSEYLALGAALAPCVDLGRLAHDLIWFSSEELGYVGLPDAVTTGSSIMPQKRNPDVLELVRAHAARLRSRHAEVGAIFGPLYSGYQRDLQLTKEPFVHGLIGACDLVAAMRPVLGRLEVRPDRCRAALQRSIGATDAVYERVARGEPFRSAYKDVAADPASAVAGDPAEAWRKRTHLGAPGALDVEPYRVRLAEGDEWLVAERRRCVEAWELLGR
ncbi:MAG: argininosuccinate lyase [Deltaproteobacteria bacterium]|nr:argininosuccinate lyase [Deltaproteobacteria bacterium]